MANFLDLIAGEGEAIMFIKSLVGTTQSASSILKQVSAAGLGIRRQTGYQVINYLRNVTQPASTYINALNLNAFPNPRSLPKSLTKQLRNFAYNVKLTGFSTITGEQTSINITVSTNSLLTKQQAIDIAAGMGASDAQSGNVQGAVGVVEGITQNAAGII